MESIPRNVILDLLPAYLAGEASEESQALVEEFAQNDPEIAGLIASGNIGPGTIPGDVEIPEKLEMKTLERVRARIRRQMLYVALGTVAILMVPFLAIQFGNEVNWSPFDFIVMGGMLAIAGTTYVLISSISDDAAYRIGVAGAVLTGFLLTWSNLAVGIIGSENNPVNALYFGVVAVGVAGALITRFRPRGMEISLYATAASQMLVPILGLIFWRRDLEITPGVIGVLLLNGFFAMLFIVSGLFFRRAAQKKGGGENV